VPVALTIFAIWDHGLGTLRLKQRRCWPKKIQKRFLYAFINAHAQKHDLEGAKFCLEQMLEAEVIPSVVAYSAALCCATGSNQF